MNSKGKITISTFHSPVGDLLVGSFENKLVLCDWRYRRMRKEIDSRVQQLLGVEMEEGSSEVQVRVEKQLEEYFAGERKFFDVALLLAGTDFQQGVWKELMNIEYGKTISYLQLAKKLGSEKAVRAVASANGANAISIIVPCHRVIGGNGELTGYAGGVTAKRRLLNLERGQQQGELEF